MKQCKTCGTDLVDIEIRNIKYIWCDTCKATQKILSVKEAVEEELKTDPNDMIEWTWGFRPEKS